MLVAARTHVPEDGLAHFMLAELKVSVSCCFIEMFHASRNVNEASTTRPGHSRDPTAKVIEVRTQ